MLLLIVLTEAPQRSSNKKAARYPLGKQYNKIIGDTNM